MDKFYDFINNSQFFKRESSTSESDTSESDSEEMPNVSNLEPFVEGSSFSEYIERFEAYIMLNRITSDTQKTVHFIGTCGSFMYSRMSSACSPRKPIEVPFTELKELLESVLCPQHLEVVERAKFLTRDQKLGESAASFALALRSNSQTCNFGESLNDQLRDRFVMGLRDDAMRRSIIQASPRTIEAALALAQTGEISFEVTRQTSASHLHQIQNRNAGNQQRFNRNSGNQRFQQRNSMRFSNNNGNTRYNYPKCSNCAKRHRAGECPAKFWKCFSCGRIGHIAICCPRNRTGRLDEEESETEDEEPPRVKPSMRLGEFKLIKNFNVITEPALYVRVNINGVNFKCEIDCGAATGVISSVVYVKYFKHCPLYGVTNKIFTLANDTKCDLCGVMNVLLNGKFKSQVLVIRSNSESAPLVGRTWLNYLYPNWRSYFSSEKILKVDESEVRSCSNGILKCQSLVDELKISFKDVFEPRSSPIRDFLVNLKLKDNVTPKFRKPSVVPYSLRETVKSQFEDMLRKGIVKRVDFSDWASQIVLAKKKDGRIRVCCNYKPTLNPCLESNEYPIPNVDDILFTLNGNKCFSVIDLSGAYLQLALDEKSRMLTTINTHIGLFSYCRVPFGVKTAPGIFQEVMDKILNGLCGVVSYFDDILIGAPSIELCKERTEAVLERLRSYNVQANLEKCEFLRPQIEYLGHVISAKGISPSDSKIKSIVNASRPRDLTSLRAFLGLLNFYSKFLPNLQSRLYPLHELLRKNVPFIWSKECEMVFNECKTAIVESPVLAFFDPSKPLTLVCDASPYGVGAILNVVVNGIERPVYMASASLSPAERNYSQYDREALAIVFGMRKFHKFVYGQSLTVFTDCEALPPILSGKKDLGTVVNSRFLRWILFLQNYDFEIRHRSSKQTVNVDALSRLPCDQPTGVDDVELNVVEKLGSFNEGEEELVSKQMIQECMRKNDDYCLLYEVIRDGWPRVPEQVSERIRIFFRYRISLDVQDGCVFFGDRLFIPSELRCRVLVSLHKGHIGIVKCKQLARRTVWWPNVDSDIESYVSSCEACQRMSNSRSQVGLFPWPKTFAPFERIHIDHFFLCDRVFLIIVDDFSNWIDVKLNKSVSSKCVIQSLKEFFTNFGLPKVLVSDNATCFSSEEFSIFCRANGIEAKKSPQYHPQSNGLAERGVGIVKSSLRKILLEGKVNPSQIEGKILDFLFKYRNTPLTSCTETPAEIIFKFKTRTNLSSLSKQETLNCDPESKLVPEEKTYSTSTQRTTPYTCKGTVLQPTDPVYYYFKLKREWVKAKVSRRISNVIYEIILEDSGNVVNAHRNCLKERKGGMKLRSGNRK